MIKFYNINDTLDDAVEIGTYDTDTDVASNDIVRMYVDAADAADVDLLEYYRGTYLWAEES